VKEPNATRRADLIFVHAPWPNACLKRINALLTVISSLTEKNGDFMKVPHADPLNITQSSNRPAGFAVNRLPSGGFALKLWGRFHSNWISSLSSGLSGNHINIISGSAEKAKNLWQAEFEITATRSFTSLNRIDYLSLAQSRLDSAAPADISLDEFVLDDDLGKHAGALYLEIKAKDQLGFLGVLLSRCAFYTLFPEAMIIETVDGKIFDRFWIKGMAGRAPSDTATKMLRQKLEGYLR
jgi:hypothetical protein